LQGKSYHGGAVCFATTGAAALIEKSMKRNWSLTRIWAGSSAENGSGRFPFNSCNRLWGEQPLSNRTS